MTPDQIEYAKDGFNSAQSREIAFEHVKRVPGHPMRIEFMGKSLLPPHRYQVIGVELENFDADSLVSAGRDAAVHLSEWAQAASEQYAQSAKEDD